MNVVCDSGARGLAQVEAHVQSARAIDLAQGQFGALGEQHNLIRCVGWDRRERGEVLIRNDHHVTGGVGVGVQAHKAVQAAMDDVCGLFGDLSLHSVCDGVVDGGDHVAKHAVLVLGLGWRPGGGAERIVDNFAVERAGVGDAESRPRAVLLFADFHFLTGRIGAGMAQEWEVGGMASYGFYRNAESTNPQGTATAGFSHCAAFAFA